MRLVIFDTAVYAERGEIKLIEVDGVRVGMVQLFEHDDAIEVGEIQIQPADQGRGIGTRLMLDTIAQATRSARKYVSLLV